MKFPYFLFFLISCAGVDQSLPPCTCNQECGDCACNTNDAGDDDAGVNAVMAERFLTMTLTKGDKVRVKESAPVRGGEKGIIVGQEGGPHQRFHYMVQFSDERINAFERRFLLLVESSIQTDRSLPGENGLIPNLPSDALTETNDLSSQKEEEDKQ